MRWYWKTAIAGGAALLAVCVCAEILDDIAFAVVALLGYEPHPTTRLPISVVVIATIPSFVIPFVLAVIGFYRIVTLITTRERSYPACANCGYNLTGNVSGVCPECGEIARILSPKPSVLPEPYRTLIRRKRFWVAFILAMMLPLGLLSGTKYLLYMGSAHTRAVLNGEGRAVEFWHAKPMFRQPGWRRGRLIGAGFEQNDAWGFFQLRVDIRFDDGGSTCTCLSPMEVRYIKFSHDDASDH